LNRARRPLRLVLLCALALPGWTDSWEAIRAATRQLTAVGADFVQEKHLPILAQPLISRGRLSFQAPGSLRWEYLSPLRSVLLLHGGRTRRFHQTPTGGLEEERGAALDAMQIVGQEIGLWLAGRFAESSAFDAALQPGPVVVMTPRQAELAKLIQRIEIVLSSRPGEIERVTIHEGGAAFTRLIFSDTRLNPQLAAALFENPQ
jgi:outer membrane lipoprotein-sorting protein